MQKIVFPRQVLMYLLKRHTEMSLQEIGSFLGGRDHSTALHSINKIENLVIEDVKTQQQIEALRRRIEKETK
jgi:chromosomal replication initiator protein